jgi:hypothetical protein
LEEKVKRKAHSVKSQAKEQRTSGFHLRQHAISGPASAGQVGGQAKWGKKADKVTFSENLIYKRWNWILHRASSRTPVKQVFGY